VDVAAGTGAVAASLAAHGARVVAVEPALAMLRHARERVGERWIGGVAARAEALPLADRCATLVAAGQAFHWFDARAALDEFARVLVPGGRLAIFWNVVIPDDFGRAVRGLIQDWNPAADPPVSQRMRATPDSLAAHEAFDVDPPREFYHARTMDPERFVGYSGSWSYVGGYLSAEERAAFERGLREVIAAHHGDGTWEERFVTVLHLALRR
jgi:SAM-dependent methyltransferase